MGVGVGSPGRSRYGPTLGQVWAVLSQVRQMEVLMGSRAEAGRRKRCQERGMEGEAGAISPLSVPTSYKGTKWRRERMWKTRSGRRALPGAESMT